MIVLAFGFFRPALAHEYQSDGSVTVLLHTNPDDDPIAAEPASLFFQVTDTANRFDAAKCDCSVTVSNEGKSLFAGFLFRIEGASIYAFTVPFTFPKKAVYSISVAGSPKTAGDFQKFAVKFDLRVDRTADNAAAASPRDHWLPYLFLGILFAGFFVYFWLKNRKKSDRGKSTLTGIFLLVTLAGLSLHHMTLAAAFCPEHSQGGEIHACCFPPQTQLAKPTLESFEFVFIWEPVKAAEARYFFSQVINNKSPPLGIA